MTEEVDKKLLDFVMKRWECNPEKALQIIGNHGDEVRADMEAHAEKEKEKEQPASET